MRLTPDDRVRIKFVRDFQTDDGVNHSQGSELLVHPATADALLLAGVAITAAGQ